MSIVSVVLIERKGFSSYGHNTQLAKLQVWRVEKPVLLFIIFTIHNKE